MKAVIVITKGEKTESWGSLTELCKNHKEFSYNYLKRQKFPFTYKGYEFKKVPYRTKTIE